MRATFALAFVTVAYLFVGTLDYRDARGLAAERAARSTAAAPPVPAVAPIWSKRCEKRGMDTLAKRADGKPWTLHCVPRRVLTVADAGAQP